MQSTKTKIVAFLIIFLSIIISAFMWKSIHFAPSEENALKEISFFFDDSEIVG